MAVPKKKKTRSKTGRCHVASRITPLNLVNCSHCGEPSLPHRACLNCGYWQGRKILDVQSKEEKAKAKKEKAQKEIKKTREPKPLSLEELSKRE